MRNRLAGGWGARENNPWGQGRPTGGAAKKFGRQCRRGVEAGSCRVLGTRPDTDEIVLRVLDPTSGDPIVAGTVTRAEAAAATAGSLGMKLKSLGLVYRLANWRFESLGN